MPECVFNIPISGPIGDMVNKAKEAIQGTGGLFEGDVTAGKFAVPVMVGKIVGKYSVDSQYFKVEIVEKPFLVPCDMIESQLKEYLSKPSA